MGFGVRCAPDVDLRVRRESQLPVGHHEGPGRDAREHGQAVQRALDRHRLSCGGSVVVDDEHVGALLALQDRGAGYDDRILLNAEHQRDPHELTGPQPLVLVGKLRLEQHAPGRRVDLVVHERQHAAHGRGRVARGHGDGDELLARAFA